MTDETLEAAVLKLRSEAYMVLGLMKDMARRPTLEDDVNMLANYAARLANLEGGMITLQQYAPAIKAAGDEALAAIGNPEEAEEDDEVTTVEVEETEENETPPVSEEELRERSPTFRKSIKESPEPPNKSNRKENKKKS